MLNVAILMGRLVADPELRHTESDIPVTSIRLGVDRSYVKSGEERQTDFLDVVAWRSTAEFICKYFTKGQMIAVNGSIQTRKYKDKDGNNRTAVEILADKVHFADSKKEDAEKGASSKPVSSASRTSKKQPPPNFEPDFDEPPMSDDDLPF